MGVLSDDHGQFWCPEQPVCLHVPAGPGQLVIARRGRVSRHLWQRLVEPGQPGFAASVSDRGDGGKPGTWYQRDLVL
jgi:hypothetical protein